MISAFVSALVGALSFAFWIHLWWRSEASGWTGPYFYVLDLPLAILWNLLWLAVFFVSHSFFADNRFKTWLGSPKLRERRLFLWTTLSASFMVWAAWAPTKEMLWSFEGTIRYVLHGIQILGLLGLGWTVKSFHVPSFLGLNTQDSGLCTTGPFALCRHPTYFFLILLLFTPELSIGRALLILGIVTYIAIGSRREELKLKQEFGAAYESYRSRTPWILPTPGSFLRAFGFKA